MENDTPKERIACKKKSNVEDCNRCSVRDACYLTMRFMGADSYIKNTAKAIGEMVNNMEEGLQNLIDMQCSTGNWDFDPYMHGMANGMILAMSLITGDEPKFLDAPDKWISKKENERDSFEKHVKGHLRIHEKVTCRICGKTADEIRQSKKESE